MQSGCLLRVEPGVRIYDLAASVGMQEPTGGLLTVVGINSLTARTRVHSSDF